MNPESPFTPFGGGQGGQSGQQPNFQPIQTPSPAPQPAYAPLPPAPLPPMVRTSSRKWTIIAIVAIITTLIAAGLAVWALINYFDQKNDVDSKITSAVATAVKEQQDTDAANFEEKEKQPNRTYAGPDDYGRLSFDYPKTWSIYVAKDAAKGGDYQAYFNPVSVPPIANDQRYALRVTIQEKDYDTVISSYQNLVKNNSLTASSIKADEQTGTRFDGNLTKDIKGSAVVFKIRDKTVTLQTDAETFKPDFDALIQTITFNK